MMRSNEQGMTNMARIVSTLLVMLLSCVPGCSGGGDDGGTSQNPSSPPACLVKGTARVIIHNKTQNVPIRMIYNGAVESDAAGNQFIALPGQDSAAKSDVVAGQFFSISAQRVDNNVRLQTYTNQTIPPCDGGVYNF